MPDKNRNVRRTIVTRSSPLPPECSGCNGTEYLVALFGFEQDHLVTYNSCPDCHDDLYAKVQSELDKRLAPKA